jgi:quercetin dioxygenase-like cupin family protein
MTPPQVVHQSDASTGAMGQAYLATGKAVAMRRWEESAGEKCDSKPREYETVGYLISGELEVTLEGEIATLHPGDSWLVPAGTAHAYRVIKPIVAVEATSPPAQLGNLDE